MNPRQKAILLFAGAVVLALVLGFEVATEHFSLLIVAVLGGWAGLMVITRSYIPLLIVGLVSPITVPVPYFASIPFVGMCLMLIALKLFLDRGLLGKRSTNDLSALPPTFMVYFGWVFVRYLVNPSLPNILGYGRNVTGFRSWLSYALCFILLCVLGRVINTRESLRNAAKWMIYFSVGFVLLLVSVSFTKSYRVAGLVSSLGAFVTLYSNGFLRFVALGVLGITIMTVAMLPNLFPARPAVRRSAFVVGVAAVVLSGNRGSFGLAFVAMMIILFLQRQYARVAIALVASGAVVIMALVLGPLLSQTRSLDFLVRPLALISPKLAEATGASENLIWRELQWQLAWENIQKHPIVGRGYIGIENAWDPSALRLSEEAIFEIDLATGLIHNGYLACALALGIPAAIFFLIIFARQIFINARHSQKLRVKDPLMADVHALACAQLVVFSGSIFFGDDLNTPALWFYMALGILATSLRAKERKQAKAAIAPVREPALAHAA